MGNQEMPLFSSAIVIDTKLFCIGRKWDCTYVTSSPSITVNA